MTARIAMMAMLISVSTFAQEAAKPQDTQSAPSQAAAPAAQAAQAPAAQAPAADAKPADASAAPGDRSDWKLHSSAAQTFLKSWGKGKWAEAKAVAGGDTVELKIAGKAYSIDLAKGASEAKLLLPYRGLSSIREDGVVKGVQVAEVTVVIGDAPPMTSKARVVTDVVGGEAKVVSVQIE